MRSYSRAFGCRVGEEVTAALFYVATAELGQDVISVNGDEGKHAVTVRRIRLGEVVALSDGAGLAVRGEVCRIEGKHRFEVAVTQRWFQPIAEPHITVVQALIKGDRMDRAIEMLTEVGADRIVPWSARNCVVRWDARPAHNGVLKLRRHALEASKQARRLYLPDVGELATTSEIRRLVSTADIAIVLHESAQESLTDAFAAIGPDESECVVVVGPEGGITASELQTLQGAGARTAHMGTTVMRAGTAGTAALGWVMGAAGRWSQTRPLLPGTGASVAKDSGA